MSPLGHDAVRTLPVIENVIDTHALIDSEHGFGATEPSTVSTPPTTLRVEVKRLACSESYQ
jgi:adenylate kinase